LEILLDVVMEKNSLEEKTSLSTQVGAPGPTAWTSPPPTGGGTCSGPTPGDTSVPVAMLVNLSELRAADFPLVEVRSLHLDTVTHGGRRTRGVAVRNLQGVGKSTFVLSVENDNDFRSRCE
jgi:hypothetical protein